MSGEHFADETGFDAALAALEDEPVEHGVTAVYPSAASRVAADDLTGALAYGFARRLRWLAIQRQARPRRCARLARAAAEASRATADGHVCIELAGLAERSGEALGVWREQLLASGLVGRDARGRPLVLDAHDRLYLARYYDYERRLARALGVLAAAREPLGAAALRERLEASRANRSRGRSDWQRVAAALSLDRRLTIISGGPGTGKTSTVVGILACLLTAHPGLRIALAAPTARPRSACRKRCSRGPGSLPASLAERLPARASTLHRLLGAGRRRAVPLSARPAASLRRGGRRRGLDDRRRDGRAAARRDRAACAAHPARRQGPARGGRGRARCSPSSARGPCSAPRGSTCWPRRSACRPGPCVMRGPASCRAAMGRRGLPRRCLRRRTRSRPRRPAVRAARAVPGS